MVSIDLPSARWSGRDEGRDWSHLVYEGSKRKTLDHERPIENRRDQRNRENVLVRGGSVINHPIPESVHRQGKVYDT